jgi:hypothetical protein
MHAQSCSLDYPSIPAGPGNQFGIQPGLLPGLQIDVARDILNLRPETAIYLWQLLKQESEFLILLFNPGCRDRSSWHGWSRLWSLIRTANLHPQVAPAGPRNELERWQQDAGQDFTRDAIRIQPIDLVLINKRLLRAGIIEMANNDRFVRTVQVVPGAVVALALRGCDRRPSCRKPLKDFVFPAGCWAQNIHAQGWHAPIR